MIKAVQGTMYNNVSQPKVSNNKPSFGSKVNGLELYAETDQFLSKINNTYPNFKEVLYNKLTPFLAQLFKNDGSSDELTLFVHQALKKETTPPALIVELSRSRGNKTVVEKNPIVIDSFVNPNSPDSIDGYGFNIKNLVNAAKDLQEKLNITR